jgi:hypothetical protein
MTVKDKVTTNKITTPLPETTVAGGAGDGGSSGPFVGVADFENKNL